LRIAEFASLAGRLLLAAVFLLAGATKFVDPLGLRKALRNFGLPDALARPAVVVLPSLELAVAVALIPASVARYGAWGALVLLTVFLLAVGVAMARGRKPDCHCFGQLHSSPVGWPTLVRNVMLVACAGGLVWSGRRYPQADLWNWLASLNGAGLKFTAIGACIAVFFFFRAVSGARPRSVPVESPPVPIAADDDIPEEPLTPGPERQYAAAPESATVPTRPGPMGIGLPIGTPAPDFELPALNGEKRSLQSLRERGRDLLLVFSSPFCDPCVALASHLVRWKREMEGLPRIVLISRGSAGDNLTKLSGFEPSLVLLQRDSEVSEAYDCNTTPTAVLIDAEGLIRSDLTVGREAIKDLLLTCQKAQIRKRRDRQAPLL
jgi:peroxiredoxin